MINQNLLKTWRAIALLLVKTFPDLPSPLSTGGTKLLTGFEQGNCNFWKCADQQEERDKNSKENSSYTNRPLKAFCDFKSFWCQAASNVLTRHNTFQEDSNKKWITIGTSPNKDLSDHTTSAARSNATPFSLTVKCQSRIKKCPFLPFINDWLSVLSCQLQDGAWLKR